MFLKQNKFLLLGTVVLVAVFLGVHYGWVRDSWVEAAAKQDEAEKSRLEWEKNFKTADNVIPKLEAEKALDENNKSLKAGLATLQQIEFGTKETLQPYSEAAVGTGDKKNFLLTKQKMVFNDAKGLNVLCTSDLGLTDKVSDDPVALNLLRLAVIKSFLIDCSKSKVQRMIKVQYFAPKLVPYPGEDSEEAETEKKPAKGGKNDKDAGPPERSDRLVQFPVKVQVLGPEPAISKLLYEIQKPSEKSRGYLCPRGFHISVRQSGTGNIEAVVGFTALLNEKLVRDLGIQVKEDDGHHGGGPRKIDLDRGY